MNLVSFLMGMVAGTFLTALLVIVLVVVLGSVAWRYARAIERAGFDLHLKPSKVTEHE